MNHVRKRMTVFAVLSAFFIFSLTSCQSMPKGLTEETEFIRESSIVYAKVGDVELELDLNRPASGKGPFPAVVFLFGGGYASGSRGSFYLETMEAARRGYVTAAIDYRLTREKGEDGKPKYQFPAQLHDAKCAVRWLRANSKKYRIDKNRIGAIGYSAGAELALMLGLTDSSDGLEGTCGNGRISSRVQAVVNIAGSPDLVMDHRFWKHFVEAYLGGSPEEVPARYKAASALTYVTPDDPPVLTICGTRDPALEQEKIFDDRMKSVGASHTLITVENAGHTSSLVDFTQDNPIWDFLDKHLKGVE